MAVSAYDVSMAEIKVFLAMSFILVGSLIAVSLGSALVWKLLRVATGRRGGEGLLTQIEAETIAGVEETDLAGVDNTRRS